MIIIWGTQNYGQTDYIPDAHVYVSTQFFHLWYIPLFPIQSYIILAESGDEFHGVATGWHLKSIAIAWLRAILLVGGILAIVGGCVAMSENGPIGIPVILGGIVGIAASIGSCYLPYTGYASYEAACELADQVGLTPEYRHKMEVAYGRAQPGHAPAFSFGQSTTSDPFAAQQPQHPYPPQQALPAVDADNPYRQQQWDDPYRPPQRF